MWSRNLIRYPKRYFITQNNIRQTSQIVNPKEIIEDGLFDISRYKVGEKIHGFEVQNIENISEFNITALQLIHEKTKAEYLHLFRNDSNNVFSINLRTTPKDSTGLPHILEHTVLCGSKLYPIRDPFFKMLNRSLATFMNAMTGSDYTMYPFSTQNFSDYRNLQRIYLDAVFRPNLLELDFMQEGWRLENVDPKDKNTDIIVKGVVYNEMKGAFSENENILGQKLQNLILPDHTYGVISGGDPLEIPDLTWNDLVQFHRKHYHPSNAKFYSYGNFPLSPSLEYVNEEYLKDYDYVEPLHTVVPKQKRWTEPKKQHIECRFENMKDPFEKQNTISISLLMSDITDIYETFLLQFLTELLIKGANAPFYKSMIEPNFSGGFTGCTGYDTQPRDTIFTIGLQGLKKTDFDKFLDLYEKTIDNVIETGFNEKQIESVLHRYELSIKHESSNFGLNLLFGLIPTWNHNGNIIDALKINNLIEQLKKNIKSDNKYLENAVKKYFKDNKHRLILTMSPDKDYETKQLLHEKEMINEKVKDLVEVDKEKIYLKGLELQKEQTAVQNTEILPTLQIHDISNEVEKLAIEKLKFGPVPTQLNKVNSNGITYFRGILNSSELTPEQQMLLPLFCYVITKLGTNVMNYREFDSLINCKTGGLNLNVHIGDSLYQLHSFEPGLLMYSYCLDKNVDDMFNLWSQIFNINELNDVKRFEMLVQLYMADLTHGIVDSGHIYAMQAASGLVSGCSYQKELLTGLQHISYMKRLVHTSNYKAMLTEIINIAKIIFDKNKLRCSLNVLEDNKDVVLKKYEGFVTKLPGNMFGKPNEHAYSTTKVWTPNDAINCQHHVLNVPVHFCSKAILSVPYAEPDYAKLRILARLLSAKYLHPELREKQGAYGGGAKITQDGVFTFYSYRDPRNIETLEVFDDSFKWLKNNLTQITEQELLEAKLGVFQAVDSPIPPSQKGTREFLFGLNTDILQRHRAALMSVNIKDLQNVGEKYLSDESAALISKVILGPKSESMNTSQRPDELWTVIDKE